MGKPKPWIIKITFVFATIALVALSLFSYVRTKSLIDSSEWVDHSHLVRVNLGATSSIMTEMESNQRGYIITRDSAFLHAYIASAVRLRRNLDKVDSLMIDNPSQQENMIRLKTLANERIEYMASTLADAGSSRLTPQRMDEGKKLMDEVDGQVHKMNEEEDRLLKDRNVTFNKEIFFTPMLTALLILFAALILFGAYLRIIRDLTVSDNLRSQLEKTNRMLEEKNVELLHNSERFFKMFDNNPVAMTFGEIGTNKVIYANNLFYSSFGYTKEEVIGHTSEELKLVSDEENARLIPIILGYLDENRSVQELQSLPPEETAKILITLRQKMFGNGFEVLYTRKNGTTFYAMVFFEVIEIGNKNYALTSYQDITERKEAEKQLEKQNEELVKMNKELESFNYVSSHDLQEPLRKIQMFSSRILFSEEQNLSEQSKDFFRRIQLSVERMQNLIRDLLAYARLTSEKQKMENTELGKIIEEVKAEFSEAMEEKQAKIEIGPVCNAGIIPFQFRQMMTNLIGNALKFSRPDVPPVITVKSVVAKGNELNNEKLIPEQSYCHIMVSDNGIGFEPQYQDRIFEVFQRLNSKEAGQTEGSGIGLSIVKKIVENHGGIITASGKLNEGARFDIYLPV